MKHNPIIIAFIICITLLLSALIALSLGSVCISPVECIAILSGSESRFSDIIIHLRLPRIITACIAGASLSVSGVLFQSLLKNPLADPYTLGVSGGASFGATIALLAGLTYPLVASFALAAALVIAMIIFVFSRRFNMDSSSLILSGVAISIFFSSAVMLLFSLAESHSVHKALMWLMGDLSLARTDYMLPSGIASAAIILSAVLYASRANLLSYGASYAHAAGVTRSDTTIIFWAASALAALSVALCGIISFVGLIVPHITRRFTGSDHRILIPASAAIGGAFLVLCDAFGRILAHPYEIPSGVITGFTGGMFLLATLFSKKRG